MSPITAARYANRFTAISIVCREHANKLAVAFTVATDWHEFFAACRYDRAVNGYKGEAIAGYIDGQFFDGIDSTSGVDFDDCKEQAWLYREANDL